MTVVDDPYAVTDRGEELQLLRQLARQSIRSSHKATKAAALRLVAKGEALASPAEPLKFIGATYLHVEITLKGKRVARQ